MTSKGLEFIKCDLHVHTPASHDYSDKSVTAKDFIAATLAKGIKVIAITDHNTGAFINQAKEAARGTDLVILPGVEVSCSGGKTGIHIIALFDKTKDEKTINALLAKIEIPPEKYGAKDAISTKSVFDVIDIIADLGGLPILAHCTSTKGVLNELTGLNRTEVFKHNSLLAVESSITDYNDAAKKAAHKRAFDLLDGTDPLYYNRKLAVYSASDAHSLKDIGNYYTYFKVDSYDINLESFRQSFIDRDVRIQQRTELASPAVPYIKEISIESGFFDGEKAEFHSGLNTIIGAKGSGKSLLVELMRFGLNNQPIDSSIRADHFSKLDLKLNQYGKVYMDLVDELGNSQKICRTYTGANSVYDGEEESIAAETFQVLFLSQNEIIRIAEDPDKQLKFIDSFFDFKQFTTKIEDIKDEIQILDRRFAQSLNARNSAESSDNTLNIYKSQLEKIEKQLTSAEYEKYKKIELLNHAMNNSKNTAKRMIDDLVVFSKKVASTYNLNVDPLIEQSPELKRVCDVLHELKNKYLHTLGEQLDNMKQKESSMQEEYQKWDEKYKNAKKEYDLFVEKNGGQVELEKERARLSKLVMDLTSKLNKDREEADFIGAINKERKAKLDELDVVYKEFLKERQNKCRTFEAASGNKLKINLHEATNNNLFKDTLTNMKKGSYLRDSDISSICNTFSARNFIVYLLRYFIDKAVNKSKWIDEVAKKCNLSDDTIKRLFDFLLKESSLEDILKLQYDARSEDRPEISVLIDSVYQPIHHVSVGQKCNAMLIIALSDGLSPVIIDQPEDSLDIRSIWDDICSRIRSNKVNRQFIFTTHNSSLAVASDTDKYTIIECANNKGHISNTGVIDSEEIKDNVIDYLEGGKPTYISKYQKYGFKLDK